VSRTQIAQVGFDLVLGVTEPATLVLSVAPATSAGSMDVERFDVTHGAGLSVAPPRVLPSEHGGLLHHLAGPTGRLTVSFDAHLLPPPERPAAPVDEVELLTYLRPSRFCPSDRMTAFALTEFGYLPPGRPRADAAALWVARRLAYVSGWSRPHDTAVDTLLSGQGVCRDYAHLLIALCRALELPARFTSVYAPGLWPMDFHSVAEVYVDGGWYAYDATGLAPRSSMVRIATGRDAADTAFLSVFGGRADLLEVAVHASVDGVLPLDDGGALVALD
jgi:transglutaminase-like putative cysteine protease